MAILSEITCHQCNQKRTVSHSASGMPPVVCHACAADLADVKKREILAALAELPLDQRVRKIEEWIYDYRPPVSMSDVMIG